MNKVYKLVWNQVLNAWVVVSELAKGKKKASKVTGIAAVVTLTLTMGQGTYAA